MKSFNWKSPNFKKWGLFFGLVLSLGFSLSWNPHYLGYAEYRTYNVEMATTSFSCDDKETVAECRERLTKLKADISQVEAAINLVEPRVASNEEVSAMIDANERDAKLYDRADAAAAGTSTPTLPTASAPQKAADVKSSEIKVTSVPVDSKAKFTKEEIDLPKSHDTKDATFVAESLKIDTARSDAKSTVIYYKIKMKTEGTASETCEECRLQAIKIPTAFASNEPGDLKVLAELIFEANKSKLVALAEKDKKTKKSDKKDKKKSEKEDKEDKILTSGLHPICQKLKGRDLLAERMDCQKEQIMLAEENCDDDDDKTCRSKIKSMYKPIKSFLSGCTRNITNPKQAERCDGADDLAAEILSVTSNKAIVSDILKIGRAKVENIARDYQLAFKSDNMHPAVAATWMSGNGGIIDRASIGLGDSFYNAIIDNENITMNENVGKFFSREFLDPIRSMKRGLYEKPLDYQIGTTMLDGLDRPMPVNIWSVRGGTASTTPTSTTNGAGIATTRLLRTSK